MNHKFHSHDTKNFWLHINTFMFVRDDHIYPELLLPLDMLADNLVIHCLFKHYKLSHEMHKSK